MPLANRRGEYSWGPTRLDGIRLMTDKKSYSPRESIAANITFKIVGGLRESFHPDVWTVAYEDFDKILRVSTTASLDLQRGIFKRKVAKSKRSVRKASFYWSRDPDLPYRIWTMVIPEDGGPPQIPRSVEDAKHKMLDVEKSFTFSASSIGKGTHRLVGSMTATWGRRSFIEKGSVSSKSMPLVVEIE